MNAQLFLYLKRETANEAAQTAPQPTFRVATHRLRNAGLRHTTALE